MQSINSIYRNEIVSGIHKTIKNFYKTIHKNIIVPNQY